MALMDDSENRTIEAARRGDRSAQALLLRQLQDRWFRVCFSQLHDHERARDAAQETALRFIRDLPKFAGQSRLTTWSIGIAINVSREMRRTDRPVPIDAARHGEDSPDLAAGDAEQGALLREMLDDLPPRQREALVLRFFEDLSTEEAAAAMGCAAGTIKATVQQALRALKQKMAKLK
jgi:RNA polymerase sigma-70 factor (ECF subfamily)